jgi:hypothetical protein
MAVGLIMEIPGMTSEVYDEVNGKVNPPDDPPDGLLFHMGGPIDGGWRVVDAWESREAFDRFAAETLGPVISGVTGGQAPPPQPVEFNIHNIEFHQANAG